MAKLLLLMSLANDVSNHHLSLKKMPIKNYYCLIFAAFICLASCEGTSSESRNAQENPCNNLHKVTNRDDLIQQLYETAFEDDCLYEMSNEELERIWVIPVRSPQQIPFDGEDGLMLNPKLRYPDYQSSIGLYVERINQSFFSLILTKNGLINQKSIFPEGEFPQPLDNPNMIKMNPFERYGTYSGYIDTGYISQDGDQMQDGYHFYWENEKRAITTSTHGYGSIVGLSFFKDKNSSLVETYKSN